MRNYKITFKQDVYEDIKVNVQASCMAVAVRKATRALDNSSYACLRYVLCNDYHGSTFKLSIMDFLCINHFDFVLYSSKGQNIYGGYKDEKKAKRALSKLVSFYNLYCDHGIEIVPRYRLVEQVRNGIYRLEIN